MLFQTTFYLLFMWSISIWAQNTADSIVTIPSIDSVLIETPALTVVPDSFAQIALDNWMLDWVGISALETLKSPIIKYDAYDSVQGTIGISGVVKERQFEFTFSGHFTIAALQTGTLRKPKDVSLQVGYHTKSIEIKPKQKRVLLIDSLSLMVGDSAYPLQVEVWLPEKITASKSYREWRDSLLVLGHLRTTERGLLQDSRDQQVYPWLQMGSNDWLSRYLNYDSPGAFPCTDKPDQILCKRYSRYEAMQICPSGWRIPDSLDLLNLQDQWQATPKDSLGNNLALSLPFGARFLLWEVHSSDTASESGVMLLSPWSGGATIAPHLWRYFETFASVGSGSLGLFQMGWDEKGWLSMFDFDETDKVRRPVRCVRSHS